MSVSRRELLKGVGTTLFGAAAGLAITHKAIGQEGRQGEVTELPWAYKKLNADIVAEKGYESYYKGACCYGVFEAIMSELRKEVGAPYTTFPSTLMVFGEGGVAGVSSLCGTLNGGAMAIFLVAGGMERKQRDAAFQIIQDLYNWYEQTPLPDYRPKNRKFEIGKSVAHSNLCHASVTNWCKTSKFKAFSKERAERCGWLAASVARHTVELLNARAAGTFNVTHTVTPATKTCRSCHDTGSVLENTRGVTDCSGCHFTGKKMQHPKI